jgi:hypothetical protein
MLAHPEATAGDDLCRHGHELMKAARDSEALDCFERSRFMGCSHPLVYEGLACANRNLGHFESAMFELDQGISRYPGHGSMRFTRSLLLLGMKRYADGWPEYEIRLKFPFMSGYQTRIVNFPRWNGEPLKGKRLLVWTEQGYGDEIMFASMFRELHEIHGLKMLGIECSRDLSGLFSLSFPFAVVKSRELDGTMNAEFRNTQFDYEIPAGSLPGLLRLKRDDFLRASSDPYLERAPGPLPDGNGKKLIGISWRGGTDQTRKVARSLTLEQLAPVFAVRGIKFVSLQHDMTKEEWEFFAKIGGYAFPFSFFAASRAIAACHFIITVCNTNVHLAGAMGKPVLCLAPFAPEWRYGFSGASMDWYSNVTVCRQLIPGDWKASILRAARAAEIIAR